MAALLAQLLFFTQTSRASGMVMCEVNTKEERDEETKAMDNADGA